MQIDIDGRKIGQDMKPYLIAELSANHNGDIERAFNTIKAAYESGADAIKIQTYTADTMTINCDREDFMVRGGLWDGYKLYDLYKWAETPFEWHKELFEYARKIGITIFSTPFDESAVDLLESLNAPAYKIASFEATDLPLLRYIGKTRKPVIISTGMCSEGEIEEAISTLHDAGCKELVVLHCISSYPAPIEQANLLQIANLAKRFNVITGLSDHTLGTTASIAAVALGACVIEKHFILNRSEKGPDSEFSIEPHELKQLAEATKDAWLALGKVGFERQPAEAASKKFRRSVYFIKNLKKDEIITEKHIRRIRPGMGLPPKYFDTLIGKRVKQDVTFGTPTSWDLIDD